MNNSVLFKILISFALVTAFVSPQFVGTEAMATDSETSLRLKIDKESFLNPDFLYLDIEVDSQINSYNAVMTVFSYDPSVVEIESVSYDNSFCSLNATSSIDNLVGQGLIICGNPEANASSTSQIARIKLKKITEGFTPIKLDNSLVLSADGLANNLLNNFENHYIMIVKDLE